MNEMSRFAKNLNFVDNLNVQHCINSTGNFVHKMYELFVFAEILNFANTLNVKNCINSMGNFVH